jgi:hypothetical protein
VDHLVRNDPGISVGRGEKNCIAGRSGLGADPLECVGHGVSGDRLHVTEGPAEALLEPLPVRQLYGPNSPNGRLEIFGEPIFGGRLDCLVDRRRRHAMHFTVDFANRFAGLGKVVQPMG